MSLRLEEIQTVNLPYNSVIDFILYSESNSVIRLASSRIEWDQRSADSDFIVKWIV